MTNGEIGGYLLTFLTARIKRRRSDWYGRLTSLDKGRNPETIEVYTRFGAFRCLPTGMVRSLDRYRDVYLWEGFSAPRAVQEITEDLPPARSSRTRERHRQPIRGICVSIPI